MEKDNTIKAVDLHLHIDGALTGETVIALSEKINYSLPTYDPVELKKYITVSKGCKSLTDFLDKFNFFYPILSNPYAVWKMSYDLCHFLKKTNCVYAEARFAPVLQSTDDFSIEQVTERAVKGIEEGMQDTGVKVKLILCCYRSESKESSIETVETAKKYLKKGVVAVDLAGDEINYPASIHKKAFELAKEYNIPVTVHAGEAGPAENVSEAIEYLNAVRIGHGIRSVDDAKLLEKIKQKNIAYEICLTSNLQTCVVDDIASHPFKYLYENNFNVTLNTDDPGVSGISISDEYELAKKSFNLTDEDIKNIIINAGKNAFLPDDEKQDLIRDLKN